MEFTLLLQKKHAHLRSKYFSELTLFLGLLFLSLFTILVLETFDITNLFVRHLNILWAILCVLILITFAFFYYPRRAKRLQKRLVSAVFTTLKHEGIKLLPNPRGGENFNYKKILLTNGMNIKTSESALTRYEYHGRLIHVLHYKRAIRPFIIIHIPHVTSPYYLQINNGNFKSINNYEGDTIVPVAYVSPYNLTYYATKGPSEVKVYLRQKLEPKVNALLAVNNGSYQYVKTPTDEFLRINNYEIVNTLCLTDKYDESYFKNLKAELKYLQTVIDIMLEKGR